MKRLVVCCDGTWNYADQEHDGKPCPTNVTKLDRLVAAVDARGIRQVPYYHPGVGTQRFQRLIGGAFGYGLGKHVRDVYAFLVDNFEPGDELFFFGFSRGAFTARSAVGMVRNSGILKREEKGRIKEAYDLYRDRERAPSSAEAQRFRDAYATETKIRFIGVWDTVGALGVPLTGTRLFDFVNRRFQFHDVELSSWVEAAYQALAIDERRGPFEPAVWHPQPQSVEQKLAQLWFAGVHSDVGGGYVDSRLSDIALLWMVEHATAEGLALTERLAVDVADNAVRGRLHDSYHGVYTHIDPYDRVIGATDPAHEAAADTAVQRHQQRHDYSPKGLVSYLDAKGPVASV
jgi:uncharacterized protein (DUF2235 family)